MSKLYFKEVQRFNKAWIWLPNLLMFAVLVFVFVQEYVVNKPSGEDKEEYWFFLFLLIPAGVLILFYIIRMETEIRRDGIYYRFYPFIRQLRVVRWEEIQSCYVRKYRPIGEYGGWGIRTGWKMKNVAYNVKGNIGLQIDLKNGKRILLGTQKGHELEGIIKDIQSKAGL